VSDKRRRMFLGCGFMLILGVGTLGIGAMLDAQTRELASTGVEATALVVAKRAHGSGTGRTHRIFLEVDETPPVKLSPRVSPEEFERIGPGDRVAVTYVRGSEDIVILGSAQEVQATHGRARWAMILGAAGMLAGVIAAISAVRMPRS
jgi:hypothetical protein